MPTDTQQARLERFAELIRTSPHNLVSRRALDELWERHVLESVAFSEHLPTDVERLLDVGSGGGFPGLVIAIMREDLEVHLLEATKKKVEFLQSAADELGLPVTVHHGRAEDLRRSPLAASFDLCTARAVAPLHRLLGWTLPFLRPGGLLYAIKGSRWRQELADAERDLRRWDGEVVVTPEELGIAVNGTTPQVVIIRRGLRPLSSTEGTA